MGANCTIRITGCAEKKALLPAASGRPARHLPLWDHRGSWADVASAPAPTADTLVWGPLFIHPCPG